MKKSSWRKQKPFVCGCGKDFDKFSQLKKHSKDTHGVEVHKNEFKKEKGISDGLR